MREGVEYGTLCLTTALSCCIATLLAATSSTSSASSNSVQSPAPTLSQEGLQSLAKVEEQAWNWHVQNTDVVQYHPDFPANYSGPKSLKDTSEVK